MSIRRIAVLLAIVSAIALLGLWARQAKRRALAMACVNNMHEISIAGRLWAEDHGGRFPSDFNSMSNELSTPYLLQCPADPKWYLPTGQLALAEWWHTSTISDCSYEMLIGGLPLHETNTAAFRCKIHGYLGYTDGVHYDGKRFRWLTAGTTN